MKVPKLKDLEAFARGASVIKLNNFILNDANKKKANAILIYPDGRIAHFFSGKSGCHQPQAMTIPESLFWPVVINFFTRHIDDNREIKNTIKTIRTIAKTKKGQYSQTCKITIKENNDKEKNKSYEVAIPSTIAKEIAIQIVLL